LDIRNLEYFIEVARWKSFSQAAEAIHISQPSISRAIKDLETQFGVALFYRNTKYVKLTDAGEIILEQAQQVVSSFENITAKLEGLTKMQTGKIHIGLPPITAVTTFSHLLGAFRREYPNIRIQLYEFGPKKIETSIQDGLLDIGIFTPDEDTKRYEKIWFEKDPLNVIMHPAHKLAQCAIIDYQDLIDEEFILYNSDYKLHDMLIDGCKQAGFTPQIALETSQREMMTQMVAANFGIALLPSKICKTLDPKTIASQPFADPEFCLRLALVWKKDRYLSHASREFLMFARKKYSSDETMT
jgi:DNA-binding transcriptional LysR family regulator